MFSAKVICDSDNGHSRLTTMVVTYPRCIHAEMLRHRVFSRNTASSRAIPVRKMIESVTLNPFIPIHWGKAQSGMQAFTEIDEIDDARHAWRMAATSAVIWAEKMVKLGLHKQVINRILEPWLWTTEIITGDRWTNFFALRCHRDAEPHMQKIAVMMWDALNASKPVVLEPGEWHMPMAEPDIPVPIGLAVCTGRLARVSYLTQDNIRNIDEDVALHDRLMTSGHWSPFEHCAQHAPGLRSNFMPGWLQYRKLFSEECK